MKILILDTYYPAFQKALYARSPGLCGTDYANQRDNLIDACFGTSDFYSRHLRELGHDAQDVVANCNPLQSAWALEHGMHAARLFLKLPARAYRVPGLRRLLAGMPGLVEIAKAQVREFRPDVLYCQDLNFFPPAAMSELKKHVGLLVGQIASPLPPTDFLTPFDLILTSFPHFVPRLQALGIGSEYFRIGFDTKVLERLGTVRKDIDATFVGGISRNHGRAVPLLEYLAEQSGLDFFGYGAQALPSDSPIRRRHHGEVWGIDMYRALARSRITLNRHIDVAENNANNMRLYEATGVGTLLLTDMKDNLSDLFEVGEEVVAYRSKEEAAELIAYYLAHPNEAEAIARKGQQRTLRDHTYKQRMTELVSILSRHLEGKR